MVSVSNYRRLLLSIEFILLFAGVPLLILWMKDRWITIGVLWAGAIGAFLYERKFNSSMSRRSKPVRPDLRYLIIRFLTIGVILTVLTWVTVPGSFLSFPREHPGLWILVMVLYPVLSVWPQEMIYRAFLYSRYEPLFGTRTGYLLASALAFGYMHVIFINTVAVVISAIGGWLFASNYARNRSLALVSVEHALYGCLIFTIGLGKYFYIGYVWR